MNHLKALILSLMLIILPWNTHADDNNTALVVWANEAIVATYTYNYQNFLERQKQIAFYFTAEGWIAYSNALNASKLPDTVKKNAYDVSAVATLPPMIKSVGNNAWQAKMPLLVVYKNPQYLQKQTLNITINFTTVASGQGIRGYAITSMTSTIATPPCQCTADAHPTDDAISSAASKPTSASNSKALPKTNPTPKPHN
jgi:hypothetical protein